VDTDTAELLAETWQSPLVLTTFVQLFESLAGPTNNQAVKLSSLEDTIILLDEPQALPERWWRFIAWTIDLLIEEFGATVVLMTATQPRLLENLPHTDDPYELVENSSRYFDFLGDNPRVEYRLDDSVQAYLDNPRTASPRGIDAAITELVETDETHVLSVGNTVASVNEQARQLLAQLDGADSLNAFLSDSYEEINSAVAHQSALVESLVSKAVSLDGPVVATLTSRLRPLDRTVLLHAIRRLLNTNKPLYVASTQLIEAGVDVSFDRVHRDFAPLPSIIQSAGRCNRAFGSETAEVILWRLSSPEHETATSDIIYRDGYDLLTPTRHALQQFRPGVVISEREMALQASEVYFQALHDDVKPGDRELVRNGKQAKFDALSDESLIPEQYPQVDIYVAVTENERLLFDAYQSLASAGEYSRLRNLRAAMASRQVSVPMDAGAIDDAELVEFPDQDYLYYLDACGSDSLYRLDQGGQLNGG
jgi:hypothetical protein